jgi:hypothetical protein
MTRLKLLGAAAVVLSSALASPLMAQQVITNPGYCAQFYPNANCQNNGPNSPYTGDYQRRAASQGDQNDLYKYGKGDWSDNWSNNRRNENAIAAYPGNQGLYKKGKGDWSDNEINNRRNNEHQTHASGVYKRGKGDWQG